MYKTTTIIILMLFSFGIYAQNADIEYPYASLIDKTEFAKAEKKIMKNYAKDSSNAMNNYAAYRLYVNKSNPAYNLERAYTFLMQCVDIYNSQDIKSKEKLEKKGMYVNALYTDTHNTSELGLEVAISENTIDSYNHYLDFYSKSLTEQQRTTACDGRNALEFIEAKKANTIESYQQFINRRPTAKETDEAKQLRNALAYKQAEAENTISAYERFIRDYPSAKETNMAQNNIYTLAYSDAKKANTESVYRNYVRKYPNSPYAKKAEEQANLIQFAGETVEGNWISYKKYINKHSSNKQLVEVAKNKIYEIAKKTHDLEALDYCANNLSGDMLDSVIYLLHDIYLDCNSLTQLYDDYGNIIPQEIRDYDQSLINAIILFNPKDNENIPFFIKSLAPYHIAYELLTNIISEKLKAKKWNEALSIINLYEDAFAGSKDYVALKETLNAPIEKDIKVTNLGSTINTTTGSEYDPVISADDKSLYFCGKGRKDNIGGEDIYVSERDKNMRWKKAHLISGINTAYGNEAPLSISADGTTMLLFQSGDIYSSEKTAYGWTSPKRLPYNINICDWQADAMITSDGQAMLFAARSKSKSELETSINIFVSVLDEYGNWGKPIDLGPTINTPGIDRSPFLHPDMKTLYFSSDKHSSMGGLDVFVSTRLSDDSWTEWSEPINMGKEINTVEDDCWYRISTDGKSAYFSKRDGKIENIHTLNIPIHMRPNMVATVSGKLTDKNNNPVDSKIRWEDLESGETIGHSKTDPADGSFFIVLPLGRIYGYYIDDDSYFPISNNIDLRNEEEAINVKNDISIVSFKQMIEDGLAVPVNNLFFNVAKSDLLPYSIPELRRVAEIIKKNKLKVEIAGHTDNTGSDETNQKLSERRAEAVKEFLVKEGCDANMLTTIGYGSNSPVSTNDTEEGRKMNRRVELRFISNY